MSVEANEIHHYPCASCGADLVFEPRDGFLTCPYCGHKEAIPEISELVEEQSYQQHFWIRPEQMEKLADNALEVQTPILENMVVGVPPVFEGLTKQLNKIAEQPLLGPKTSFPLG